MYSGVCLQQFRVADHFEPECTIFLYVKDAIVQWSKHTTKSMKAIMSATQKTHVSVNRSTPWARGDQLSPLPPTAEGTPGGMPEHAKSRKGEETFRPFVKWVGLINIHLLAISIV